MQTAIEFDHAEVLTERDGDEVTPRHVFVDYKVNAPELVSEAIPEGTPMEEVGDRIDMLLGSVESPVSKAIYSDPATVVIFEDGGKVVAKTSPDDEYDPRVGSMICAYRKATRNRGSIDAKERAIGELLCQMGDEEAMALSQAARLCESFGCDPVRIGQLLMLTSHGWEANELADTLMLYAAIREAE